jgi:hypothetical protein
VSFLHPLALLGLAAAAIPALLHLLQRRTPPEVDFPPIRYLTEAERQSARRLKLRHLLLLVLRTALIIVIVLAAARPLVPVTGGGGGGHEPTALAVILDNSPSSGAMVDGRPVLDRLRAAARAALARTTPADRVWLILADGIVRRGSRDALLASVDSAAPGWQRLDLVQAVERAARLVHAEPLTGREVHVLSDLQASALAAGRAAVPAGVRVLAPAPARPAPNRGLAEVRVADGAALVTINGSDAADAAPITMRVATRTSGMGGETRALAAPGASVSMPLPPATRTPGWWVGEVVLAPDELRADDRRLAVWQVADPARVAAAAVTGPFVAAALAVLREARRVADGGGGDVVIGDGLARGARSIVLPPADPALVGQANRAFAARGVAWRWGTEGTPGRIAAPAGGLEQIAGVQVTRRYRIVPTGSEAPAGGSILATVNGEPWLVRSGGGDVVLIGSRLDTAWTALPATPGFVPFVDALVNRVVAGEAEIAQAEGTPRVDFQVVSGDTVGATVFGPDPRESDLTRASGTTIRDALGGRGGAAVEVLEESRFAGALFAGTRRADISGLLLLFALMLCAVELGVATLTR